MEIDLTVGLILLILAFFVGLMGMMWQNPVSKARFLSRTRRKNYGVVTILTKGKRLVQFVQDLSEPLYKFRNMVLDPQKQNPYSVYSFGDVPCMFYYDVDSSPVILETKVKESEFDLTASAAGKSQLLPIIIEPDIKVKAKEFNSDPNALFAAFESYSELIRKQMAFKLQTFFMLLVASAVLSAAAAYFAYDMGGKLDAVTKQLIDIKTIVDALKATAAAPVA